MSLLLFFLKISFFFSHVFALGITVQSATIVGQPSLVLWTREPSDGGNELTFDLRFVRGTEDVGLAIANIHASSTDKAGIVEVTFSSPGAYALVAVSGPNATNVGKSGRVVASAIPLHSTTSRSPTSTSQPTPSATPLVHTTPTASKAHRKKNLGAIIGGTLGGVAFLGLLVAMAIMFRRRRRPKDTKRWTFHRDMMVRPGEPDVVNTAVVQPSSPQDIERGLRNGTRPCEVMIASPNGPRPLIKPRYLEFPQPPSPLTTRQMVIVERMQQLKGQMMELERNAGPTQHIMLDDMQKQMSWLQDQVESAWALGLTDVTPLGFAHNMTP